jgi:cytoskeletal protein RodZ
LTFGFGFKDSVFIFSSKKLDELLNLKDDAKHPDLSKLLKCSAEFQSELAKESGKQSRNHLIVSIIALLIATVSIGISLNKEFNWLPLKTDKPPKATQEPNPKIDSPKQQSNIPTNKDSSSGDKKEGGEPKPASNPK